MILTIVKRILIFLFVILCLVWLIPEEWIKPPAWEDALTTHTLTLKNPSHLELLWVKTVYTFNSDSYRTLAATNGKVFFIGSVDNYHRGGLVALDGKNGNELWVKNENRDVINTRIVEVGPELVYSEHRSYVVANNLNGKEVWKASTNSAGKSIDYIQLIDDKLYTSSGAGHLILDAVSGKQLNISNQFEAFGSTFNPSVWFNIGTPIFAGHRIFGQGTAFACDLENAALAFDQQSGDLLWATDRNLISDVVATQKLAFYITYDDELRILDAKSGKLVENVRVEPSIGYFELAEETNVQHEGYSLAVDQTTQTLYVLLGDSNQLFAFRIHE